MKPPWKLPRPKGKRKPLTPSQKVEAKARAKKAGRPYPNLVDNMAAARKQTLRDKTNGNSNT